jgi:hypothetical protein
MTFGFSRAVIVRCRRALFNALDALDDLDVYHKNAGQARRTTAEPAPTGGLWDPAILDSL